MLPHLKDGGVLPKICEEGGRFDDESIEKTVHDDVGQTLFVQRKPGVTVSHDGGNDDRAQSSDLADQLGELVALCPASIAVVFGVLECRNFARFREGHLQLIAQVFEQFGKVVAKLNVGENGTGLFHADP